MNKILENINEFTTAAYVKAGCATSVQRDSRALLQAALFACGVVLLASAVGPDACAYEPQANYNDDRMAEATDVVLTYINGTFGALVMVTAGVFAIMSAAFGQYRAALSLLVVAVGSFILRSLVSTWFNDQNLTANTFRN
jgi:hypothetical protein